MVRALMPKARFLAAACNDCHSRHVKERHGVFIDYNQNAKDRTVAGAYSVRPTADARVSAPLDWSEVPDVDPADFTLVTMPKRFGRIGDPHAGIDDRAYSLDGLLELSQRHERDGEGDAPWPPQYAKAPGEPKRVQPSRRARPQSAAAGLANAAGSADAAGSANAADAAGPADAAASEAAGEAAVPASARPRRKPSAGRKAS